MTDINISISQSADDCYCKLDQSNFTSAFNYLYLGVVSSQGYHNGLVFRNVTIPAGSTIDSAVVRFKAYNSLSNNTVNQKVHCEAADDATVATSGSQLRGLSLTAGVAWSSLAAWTDGNDYDTVDIKAEVQAVIDRAGWSSGNKIGVHVLDNISSAGAYRQPSAFDYLAGAEAPELRITYTAPAVVESEIGYSDEIDAFNLSDEFQEGIGFADEIEAFNTSGYLEDEIGFSDAIDAGKESYGSLADEIGFADEIGADRELFGAVASGIGFADEIEAFNWAQWWTQNKARAVARYYFTLTGAADSTTDIEIPISSFSARKRTGEDTYLSVVIPDYATWAAAITARSNGEMIVELAYLLDGEVSLREEILRADLEEINLFKGPMNRSIALTGHKTQTFAGKVSTLEKSIYRGFQGGRLVHRFAIADPYLDPGDTCKVDSDEFTVDNIVYMIDTNRATVEVRE